MGLGTLAALIAPWLRHNWITTLGGTNRAVLESAAAEGDPSLLSAASWLWYPRLWPAQLGLSLPVGLAGALAALWRRRRSLPVLVRHPLQVLGAGWPWLIGCAVSGLVCTTLSPNKDARYIAPVLPLLLMLLARGWWQIGLWLQSRWGSLCAWLGLAGGLLSAEMALVTERFAEIDRERPAPIEQVISRLRVAVGAAPTTLLVVPGSPGLNEENVTTFGRLDGGQILGRRLGRRASEHPLVLDRSEWLLLATGDQGTDRPLSRELSHRIRADGRFRRVGSWPWNRDREVELWQRRPDPAAQANEPFDSAFRRLARGMEKGPAGLAPLFDRIGPEHQLDGHFLYQRRVKQWARQRLVTDPADRDALWSLALVATLRNRPAEAASWYARLQRLEPDNPWPVAYRTVVLLAGWKPWEARSVIAAAPDSIQKNPVVGGLGGLSRLLSGDLTQLGTLRRSLPEAYLAVEKALESEGGH